MKTKRSIKRMVAYVLCMVILASNMVVMNVTASTCPHMSKYLTPVDKGVVSYNEGQHIRRYVIEQRCSNRECNALLEIVGTHDVAESHSMNRYTDEGHFASDIHRYRLYCSSCGFNTAVAIDCGGGSSHATPW